MVVRICFILVNSSGYYDGGCGGCVTANTRVLGGGEVLRFCCIVSKSGG